MYKWVWTITLAAALMASTQFALAASPEVVSDGEQPSALFTPVKLSIQPEPESIYAPPQPMREEDGVNNGGVNIDLEVRYVTDDVYRGIDHSEVGGNEDSPNLQFDGRLSFNLGKLPHPFVGIFVNVFDSDPVSRFQEIRPYFGLEWTIRPFILSGGSNSYIYPEREEINTSEVYGKIEIDDSFIFSTEKPILSPYIYAAYDYDLNNGWYFEAGVKHDFQIEDTGITVTAVADIAYISGIQQQFVFIDKVHDEGFQHYDLGLIASYSLNTLFNTPRRFGEWKFNGYLFYTDGLSNDIRADTQLWGGVGIGFKY